MPLPSAIKAIVLFVAIFLMFTSSTAVADIIFSDDFSALAEQPLNGSLPDVSTNSSTWVADSTFRADGSRGSVGGGSNSTLAFQPQAGFRYTLDLSIRDIVGTTQWWGFGFTDRIGGNLTRGRFERADANLGRSWSIVRGSQSNNAVPFVANFAYQDGQGIETPWAALNDGDGSMFDIDVRIVLDTRSEFWSAQHFAKSPSDSDFTLVAFQPTLSNQSTIDAVGFAVSSNQSAIDGRVAIFQLSAVAVPEPSSFCLVAFSGAFVLFGRRRHRQHKP